MWNKPFKAIHNFWFKNYSFDFFFVYRIILFSAAAYYSYTAGPLSESCDNWSPVGVLKWIHLPCQAEFYVWSARGAVVFCLLSAIPVFYTLSSKLAFVSLLLQWGLFSSYGKVANSLHLMTMAVGLMALCKNSEHGDRGINYGWALQLIKVYAVWIYFMNGLEQIFWGDWNWALSDNLFLMLSMRPYLGDMGHWLLTQAPMFTRGLAVFTLYVAELGSPLALIGTRMGILYFFIWAGFHFGISAVLGGHQQFWSQIFVLTIFLPLHRFRFHFTAAK